MAPASYILLSASRHPPSSETHLAHQAKDRFLRQRILLSVAIFPRVPAASLRWNENSVKAQSPTARNQPPAFSLSATRWFQACTCSAPLRCVRLPNRRRERVQVIRGRSAANGRCSWHSFQRAAREDSGTDCATLPQASRRTPCTPPEEGKGSQQWPVTRTYARGGAQAQNRDERAPKQP